MMDPMSINSTILTMNHGSDDNEMTPALPILALVIPIPALVIPTPALVIQA